MIFYLNLVLGLGYLHIVLINEIAFSLFGKIIKRELPSSSIDKIDFYQNENFTLLVEKVKKSLLRFTYGSKFSLPFNEEELRSIRSLTLEILNHFKEYPDEVTPNSWTTNY